MVDTLSNLYEYISTLDEHSYEIDMLLKNLRRQITFSSSQVFREKLELSHQSAEAFYRGLKTSHL